MLPDSKPTVQPPGNRCGHNPHIPRSFEPPESHKARPGILRKLIEKLAAYYDSPAKILPSLNLANGKESQQRSERREACLQLLSCLIHFLDLVTLRVGIPETSGSFRGLSLRYLAGLSGLGLRRAERACYDLVAAGILTVHPIAKKTGIGEFKGLPAIRTICKALFRAFNLGYWLKRERDKASKRKQQEKRGDAAMGRVELAIKAAQVKTKSNRDNSPLTPEARVNPKEPLSVIAYLTGLRGMLKETGPP